MPACSVIQLCQTICNTNCSPPSSSILGILQARILSGLPCLLPGDLLNPGIQPTSSESPVLQANSLPWATEEAHSFISVQFSQFNRSVVSDPLRPHESQHSRPPCPSQTPGVYSDSCPSSQWCHPAISSSVVPFSSCPQSLPASGSFPMSQLFAWGGKSIGVSASASVLPMNTQDLHTRG